jgi:hypothetical protein
MSNTTIFQNETGGRGGGLLVRGPTFLNNVTIADNIAGDQGGGLINDGRVQFSNSIIAGNTATNSGPDCFDNNAGNMSSGGPNLIQDQTDCVFSGPAALSGDPLLGSLANNGGPTQTLALLAGSPALDTGDDATCESADQRGTVRPQGTNCDLGAFEAGPSADLSALQLVFDVQEIGTTSAAQTVTLTNNGPIALTINGVSLGGTEAADFAQTNNCGGTVAAGDSCDLSFTFTPGAEGVRQAEASLDTSANVQTITLLGAGVEAGADTGGDTGDDGGDTAGDGNSGGGCSLIP